MVENDIILGELKSNNTEGVINAEKQNEAVVTEEKVETEKTLPHRKKGSIDYRSPNKVYR